MDNGASSYLRFLNGDNNGFTEIVREYKDGLMLFINCNVGDIHISEEIADETFLRLYVKKPEYKKEYSFKTWLYAIGRNTAVNYLKKLKRQPYAPLEDYYYISDETDIESEHIRNEEHLQVHKAIKRLNPEYSQVLYLVFFEELSTDECAVIMGKRKRQIYDLLYRAKESLKKELEKEGLTNGQI